MNLSTEPRELKAGNIIGAYQLIKENQVEVPEVLVKSCYQEPARKTWPDAPLMSYCC